MGDYAGRGGPDPTQRAKSQNRAAVQQMKIIGQSHQTGLTPNLLRLFQARPPPEFKPLLVKRKLPPYQGIAQFIQHFAEPGDAEYAPPVTKAETKLEKKTRIQEQKLAAGAKKVVEDLEKYDPTSDPNVDGDPYKTLFVARISYETTEQKLKREFEAYGAVKKIRLVNDTTTDKPRGYAFIEYYHTRDMKNAYKQADGRKIDSRRVIVDVERGRTVPNWRPRRLGGGMGNSRMSLDQKPPAIAVAKVEEPQEKERSREREPEPKPPVTERVRSRERDEPDRKPEEREHRSRDRERERDRDKHRDSGSDRLRSQDRERDRDRGREERPRDRDRDRTRDRRDRGDRSERGERGDRSERVERSGRERGERGDRPERGDRDYRDHRDRGEYRERGERGERGQRSQDRERDVVQGADGAEVGYGRGRKAEGELKDMVMEQVESEMGYDRNGGK